MSGGQLMVVLIVSIVMVASIIKAKYGHHGRRHDRVEGSNGAVESAETIRMREELKMLRDRLAVLERITIEKENSLEREIEQLRDR
jgi:hypothetical protein